MAKGSNLILQGLKGKIGGIVVSRYADGESVIRSRPSSVRQPNTDPQKLQKGKFSKIVEIARLNKNIIRAYTKPKGAGVSAYSTFVGRNVKGATGGSASSPVVVYEQIRTVTGGGADVYGIDVTAQNNVTNNTVDDITLTWTYDPNNPTQNLSDNVGIVIIDTSIGVIKVEMSVGNITDNTATFQVPVPTTDDKYIIPFMFSSSEGYGAEIAKYVLQTSNSAPAINNR